MPRGDGTISRLSDEEISLLAESVAGIPDAIDRAVREAREAVAEAEAQEMARHERSQDEDDCERLRFVMSDDISGLQIPGPIAPDAIDDNAFPNNNSAVIEETPYPSGYEIAESPGMDETEEEIHFTPEEFCKMKRELKDLQKKFKELKGEQEKQFEKKKESYGNKNAIDDLEV